MSRTKILFVSFVLGATALVARADAPTPPAPPSSFELIDRGTAVEIVAHGVKATRTAIAPIRSRLEVPIAPGAVPPRMFAKGDATVMQVELDGAPSARVVSVKLKYEHPEVVQFARFAQAVQVGDDLHILVPRAIPAEGQAAHLPEPTLPTLPATGSNQPAAVLGPQKPIEVPKAPEIAKVEAKTEAPKSPEAKIEAKTVQAPKPAVAASQPAVGSRQPAAQPAPEPAKPAKLGGVDEQSPPTSMLLAGGLVLCGGAMFIAKKRKKAAQAALQPTIDLVAQRSLGGKAKIVWLNAAGRDLVVAVTPQQVRMLHASAMEKEPKETRSIGARPQRLRAQSTSRISTSDIVDEIPSLASAPRTRTSSPLIASAPPAAPASRNSSPQISGLLKLREEVPALAQRARLGTPPHGMASPLADEVATDDYEADEMWAKEIRAATLNAGGRK